MNIFLIILAILAIGICCYFYSRFLAAKLPKSTEKVLLISIVIAGTLLSSALLIMAHMLPGKVNEFMSSGVDAVEKHIDNISPGYIHEVADTQRLKAILEDYRQIEAGLGSNEGAMFVVKTLGMNTYMEFLGSFVSNIDENIREMEAEQIPITLHNIFVRVQDKSKGVIQKIAYTLEIGILIATVIFFIIMIASYFVVKHNDMSGPKVVMGEDLQ